MKTPKSNIPLQHDLILRSSKNSIDILNMSTFGSYGDGTYH